MDHSMRKFTALAIFGLLVASAPAFGQQGIVIGPLPPCSSFGTTSGTCAQGNDSRITGAAQVTSPTFTLTATNFTTVGTLTISPIVVKFSNAAGFMTHIDIGLSSTTTFATTANSSYLGTLPTTPSVNSACTVIDATTVATLGNALVSTLGRIYMPTISATGDSISVSCNYQTAS